MLKKIDDQDTETQIAKMLPASLSDDELDRAHGGARRRADNNPEQFPEVYIHFCAP